MPSICDNYPIYTWHDQAFAKIILASLAMARRAFRFTLARQIFLKLHLAYMNKKQKSSLGEGVCLHLILAETVSARLTILARVKLAQCK